MYLEFSNLNKGKCALEKYIKYIKGLNGLFSMVESNAYYGKILSRQR